MRSMKNRESAVRSRKKKDDLIEQLTSQVSSYTKEITDLVSKNEYLRDSLPCLMDMDENSVTSECVQRFLEPAEFYI